MKNLSKFCPCLKRSDSDNATTSPAEDDAGRTPQKFRGLPANRGLETPGRQGSLTSLASSTQQIPSIHTLELYSPDPDHVTTHSECSFAVSREYLAMLKKSSSIVVNIPSSRGSLTSLEDRWNSRNTLQLSINAGGRAGRWL